MSAVPAFPQAPVTGRLPLAITLGDAAGIGPETILLAFAQGEAADALVLGDVAVLRRAAGWLRACGAVAALPPIAVVEQPADVAGLPPGVVPVLVPPGLPDGLDRVAPGTIDRRCGAAAAACVRAGAALALRGEVTALVTAPLHKEALAAAGEPYPGHTELLAAESARHGQPAEVRMMLANDELKTVLVSVHLSLRRAIEAVSFDAVLQTIGIAHAAARRWGLARPRIAVAGLNPHAGEGGLFGDEEQRIIAPAVAAACEQGIDARGPFAPDTVFMRARHAPGHPGEFDLVVAMYHDQGLIPVKYLGVEHGVNVTLGLPFVRTSPDHGTAFDIAGTGRASPASLVAALRMARRLAGSVLGGGG
jgi:4-hydroxythreonine-4-phosphate dehydrogenase